MALIINPLQHHILGHACANGVYLAGPVSASQHDAAFRFAAAAAFIRDSFPSIERTIIPLDVELPEYFGRPLTLASDADFDHSRYMRALYPLIDVCSVIALLPGWQYSRGTMYEARYAESLGIIPLFLFEDETGALEIDAGDTFRAIGMTEWVDCFAAICARQDADAVHASLGQEPALTADTHSIGAGCHRAGPTINPVPVGGDPNPWGAGLTPEVAEAIRDARIAALFAPDDLDESM